jgi:hypothetical protein
MGVTEGIKMTGRGHNQIISIQGNNNRVTPGRKKSKAMI